MFLDVVVGQVSTCNLSLFTPAAYAQPNWLGSPLDS